MGELGVDGDGKGGADAAAELMAAVAQADLGGAEGGIDFDTFLGFCRKARPLCQYRRQPTGAIAVLAHAWHAAWQQTSYPAIHKSHSHHAASLGNLGLRFCCLQAGLMKALPHVDRETADTLRARQHGQGPAGVAVVASASPDALDSEGADTHDAAASLEYDTSGHEPPQLSSCDELRDDDVSSGGSAGFARAGHVVRLLSVAPFSSASSSSSSSYPSKDDSDNGSRTPQTASETATESREQPEAIELASLRTSMNFDSISMRPTNKANDIQCIQQRGDGATSAQPAALLIGGLPSPDNGFVSATARAISSTAASGEHAASSGSGMQNTDASASATPPSASTGHSLPARRPISLKKADRVPSRQQHQQHRRPGGKQQPSAAPEDDSGGGVSDAHQKRRRARSGGFGGVSQLQQRGPMQSLFWVLKNRNRETARSSDIGSFALVAEAARDGSLPRVCDQQGDGNLAIQSSPQAALHAPCQEHVADEGGRGCCQLAIGLEYACISYKCLETKCTARFMRLFLCCRCDACGPNGPAAEHGPFRHRRCQQLGLRRCRGRGDRLRCGVQASCGQIADETADMSLL